MKKALIFILIGILLGAAASWAFVRYVVPRWRPSHVDNTFYETTSRLDKGGEVFAYLHAEQVIRAVRDALNGLGKTVELMPEEHQAKAGPGLAIARMLFDNYGLDEISGLGISSFSFKPGLHRVRFVLHHRPGQNQGLIWNTAAEAPRALEELDLMPPETALVLTQDADIAGMIEWAGRAGARTTDPGGRDAAGPTPEQIIAMMKIGLQAAGIDFDRLMASYGGRIGYLVTLDTEKRVALKTRDKHILIPEPAFALFIRVNDDYLFETLKERMADLGQGKISEDEGEIRIVFPPLPAPFPLDPVITQKEGWLVAASRLSLLDDMFSGRSPRLADDKAFKEISARLPRKGHGFGYVSPRLFRAVAQALRENMSDFPAPAALARIAKILDQSKGICQVREITDQGLVTTVNHGFDVAALPELIDALAEIARKTADDVREADVPALQDEELQRPDE